MLSSRYTEIGFARHARTAPDAMRGLAEEFTVRIDRSVLRTPYIDKLRAAA